MKLNKIFFSPTNTTKKILDGITKGISATELQEYNLNTDQNSNILIESGLSLIGLPVYNGSLPENALKQFDKFNADKQLCVVIVTYGDENYEDSLDELKELVKERGFIPIASAAFIGKTFFEKGDKPIAVHSPDRADMEACFNFGKKIKEKIDFVEKIIDDVLLKSELEQK